MCTTAGPPLSGHRLYPWPGSTGCMEGRPNPATRTPLSDGRLQGQTACGCTSAVFRGTKVHQPERRHVLNMHLLISRPRVADANYSRGIQGPHSSSLPQGIKPALALGPLARTNACTEAWVPMAMGCTAEG